MPAYWVRVMVDTYLEDVFVADTEEEAIEQAKQGMFEILETGDVNMSAESRLAEEDA